MFELGKNQMSDVIEASKCKAVHMCIIIRNLTNFEIKHYFKLILTGFHKIDVCSILQIFY